MRRHRKVRGRRLKKQRRIILASIIGITLLMTAGYAAFGTNISITAKGNMKDRVDLYVSSNGSDTTGVGSKTNPYATIGKAYDKAPSSATIYVMDDINQDSTIEMNSNKDIVLTSYSTNDKVNSIIRGNMLTEWIINQTLGTLTLKNITIDGNDVEASSALLNIEKTVTIDKGAVLTKSNNVSETNYGGAIKLIGVLYLNGGVIEQNKAFGGGGIYALENSTIIINSGTINNNQAPGEGGTMPGVGGGIFANGHIEIKDGNISYNTANRWGGGIACSESCSIHMVGGTISNNTVNINGGGGISSDGEVVIDEGEISYNQASNNGGGLRCVKLCTINSGKIQNNTAGELGGGIYAQKTTIIHGGEISNNSAVSGGGIGTATSLTIDGGIIKNNTATTSDGGINKRMGTYTYKSGIICGNTPANSYETHTTCP